MKINGWWFWGWTWIKGVLCIRREVGSLWLGEYKSKFLSGWIRGVQNMVYLDFRYDVSISDDAQTRNYKPLNLTTIRKHPLPDNLNPNATGRRIRWWYHIRKCCIHQGVKDRHSWYLGIRVWNWSGMRRIREINVFWLLVPRLNKSWVWRWETQQWAEMG